MGGADLEESKIIEKEQKYHEDQQLNFKFLIKFPEVPS